jgi:hypothetical protein
MTITQEQADFLVTEAKDAWQEFANTPENGDRLLTALDKLQSTLNIDLNIALDIAQGKTKVSIQNGKTNN